MSNKFVSLPLPPRGLRIGQKNALYEHQVPLEKIPEMEAINLIAMQYGYNCIQINGQRIFARNLEKPDPQEEPGIESEIHIANISKHSGEEQILAHLLKNVGGLYEMRTMFTFTGECRGYAFAKFINPERAAEAIHQLTNFSLDGGRKLEVTHCRNNTRVAMINLQMNYFKPEKIVWAIVNLGLGGLKSVLVTERNNKQKFSLVVEFTNHRDAALGRRAILTKRLEWSQTICVDWLGRITPDKQGMMKFTWTPYCLGKNHQAYVTGNPTRSSNSALMVEEPTTRRYSNPMADIFSEIGNTLQRLSL